MNENPPNHATNEELKRQNAALMQKLHDANQQVTVQQNDSQEKLLKMGSELLDTYLKNKANTERFLAEKQAEYQHKELETVERLDFRDKIYKGLMLIFLIAALLGSTQFGVFDKLAPIISLLIGLLFKNSLISEFFTATKKRSGDIEEE
ncbi:hypothetical protein ACAW74_27945 [Fibrella sp. WM1]